MCIRDSIHGVNHAYGALVVTCGHATAPYKLSYINFVIIIVIINYRWNVFDNNDVNKQPKKWRLSLFMAVIAYIKWLTCDVGGLGNGMFVCVWLLDWAGGRVHSTRERGDASTSRIQTARYDHWPHWVLRCHRPSLWQWTTSQGLFYLTSSYIP